jgi:predicted acylesterase/phospholipase RssA
MSPRDIALSFTGSGLLLTYQLGCAKVLRGIPQVVAGSSGGAIVATLLAFAPDSIEDYVREFIQQGVGSMKPLEMFNLQRSAQTELHILATKNSTGQPHIFEFKGRYDPVILDCLKASNLIPPSFHPTDLLNSKTRTDIPDIEEYGVVIDGDYYCDGAITAPAPPTPAHLDRVIVTPIVGVEDNSQLICPPDEAWKITPSVTLQGGFRVRVSVQNTRALRAAAGWASRQELEEYYAWGIRDAEAWMKANYSKLG